ncbi:unnamed protein product [Phyllotreta striolata]|uniref:Uncharacterized protein n=1 Tax=Phyllotreta striolata TaxID=444603 RepID=A0A9P0GW02_PHYSR|nr:unnamed protein product [Phyllotreta striolata]
MSLGGVFSSVLLLISGLLLFGSTTSGLVPDTSTARYNFLEEVNAMLPNRPKSGRVLGGFERPNGPRVTVSGSKIDRNYTISIDINGTKSIYSNEIGKKSPGSTSKTYVKLNLPLNKTDTPLIKVDTTTVKTKIKRKDPSKINNKLVIVGTKATKLTKIDTQSVKSNDKISKSNGTIVTGTTKIQTKLTNKDKSKINDKSSTKTPTKLISTVKKTTKPIKTKSSTKTNKVRPVLTEWKDASDMSEIKQIWYEDTVPYPNPNPTISSPSPSVALSQLSDAPATPDVAQDAQIRPEISSFSPPYALTGVPDLAPSNPPEQYLPSNPLNTFKLDIAPDEGALSPCPSVHISSALMPEQRQDCSDINLVINSHLHQNQNRLPAAETYDSPVPEEAEAVEAAEPVLSDPGTAAQSAVSQAGPGAGGTGGSGGSGGSGGDNGGFHFPDMKHLFEAAGYLWNGLGKLFGFLRNPYLYIVPAVLFFVLGFLKVLALFPWWIPLLLLYVSVKGGGKNHRKAVSFYKHEHRPVKHLDGWYWNHRTKTWRNVVDERQRYHHRRKEFDGVDYDEGDSLSGDLSRIYGIYLDGGGSGGGGKKKRY